MPRLTRAFLDYSCYHIITRGNQKQNVFRNQADYKKYLEILKKSKKKYSGALYAYCLMPTHVHLLVEFQPARNISKFMQWLNRGYTAYFNAKYQKVGHLWQGRFISKPIVRGAYLIHCAQYIEANPLRGNLVQDIMDYPWSSYRERCLLSQKGILNGILIGTPLKSETGTV